LDHAEGVLVLQPMEWQARALPWRLPDEVAFALGVFFRDTRSNGPGTRGAAHGDFAPWNLLRTEGGWGLLDWEDFTTGAPPYFDLFHYFVQSNSELRRPTKQTILDGLRLKGWVGSAIAAYAAGAEVDAGESEHFLREYLRISTARFRMMAAPRGARVRLELSRRLER
jgi:aminoglycoside phosphotransferase (APT) family kinase protein